MRVNTASNEALREAIGRAGVSYDQLAREVRAVAAEAGDNLKTNKSAVCHWVAGKQPAQQTAAYIAEALSRHLGRQVRPSELGLGDMGADQAQGQLGLVLGPDPVDMLVRLGDADIRRRSILTGAAYSVTAAALPLGVEQSIEYQARASKMRAGCAEIAAVQDMVAMYTAIDERHGGQHGRSAVVQYLTSDVARLCRARFDREVDRKRMLSMGAEVAYLAGWKAYDAGEHGLAQRYYLQAYQLTKEADDLPHQAWILRILAHNGMDIRRPEYTLELADAALERARGRVNPAAEALFVVTRARALAVAGRGPEATAQLREAQDLVLRGDVEELPHWAALWGLPRATVNSHTAKTFKALGDHANAERHYAASARIRPGRGSERITALDLAAQATAQVAQGHVEQACDTWQRSLDLLKGVRSSRANDAVAGMRRHLSVFARRGTRAAADLDQRATAWQRSMA